MKIVVGLALALLVLPGCGAVLSKNPLSGDADTVVDEALIGHWEPEPDKDKPDGDRQRVAIGRVEDDSRTLEIVIVEITKSGHIDVQRAHILATKVDGVRYLSLTDAKKADDYMLLRYAIGADGMLTLHWMDERAVAKQIEAKAITGVVEKNPKYDPLLPSEAEFDKVKLTAETPSLRAWVAKTGEAPWFDKPLRFRKVVLEKPGAGDAEAKPK